MTLWDKIAAWYHRSVFCELFRHLSDDVFGVHLGDYENLSLGASAAQTARTLILSLMFGVIFAAAAVVYTKTVPCGFLRRLLSMDVTAPDRAVTLNESGYFRSTGVRRDLRRGGMLAKFLCRPDDSRTLAGTIPSAETAAEIANEAANGEAGKPSLVERLTAPDRPATVSEQPTKPTDETDETKKADAVDETPSEPALPRPVNFLSDRFYIPEPLRARVASRCEKTGSGIRGFLAVTVLAVVAAALLCRALPLFLSLANRIRGI